VLEREERLTALSKEYQSLKSHYAGRNKEIQSTVNSIKHVDSQIAHYKDKTEEFNLACNKTAHEIQELELNNRDTLKDFRTNHLNEMGKFHKQLNFETVQNQRVEQEINFVKKNLSAKLSELEQSIQLIQTDFELETTKSNQLKSVFVDCNNKIKRLYDKNKTLIFKNENLSQNSILIKQENDVLRKDLMIKNKNINYEKIDIPEYFDNNSNQNNSNNAFKTKKNNNELK